MPQLKARLIAKGYAHIYEVDYVDTFSSVAKITTIRLVTFIIAFQHWPLHQFDTKNASLHDDLQKRSI